MAMHLRYYGEFVSTNAHINRVGIYQESETAYEPQSLTFPYDYPLVLEWSEQSKESVILGSTCSLKVCASPTQRFDDLYQIEYGKVRIDIWRDGEFFWSGQLDTELYEEPYETWSGDVTLTFSDFNYLSRCRFDMGVGFKSIKSILMSAIYKTKCVRLVNIGDFDESFDYSKDDAKGYAFTDYPVGTTDDEGNSILNTAYARTDNFQDETGEWMTYAEVIEGILKPLGVRMVQMEGLAYFYDFDTLYKSTNGFCNKAIYWTADAQTMSIDKTFNNVKITWSPYANVTDLIDSECWNDKIKTSANIDALGLLDGKDVGTAPNTAKVFTYYMPYSVYNLQKNSYTQAFSLWMSSTCKNITLESGRYVFKTVAHYDGDDSEGVMAYAKIFKPKGVGSVYRDVETQEKQIPGSYFPVTEFSTTPSARLFSTPHSVISPQSTSTPMRLRLTMECLVDVRINPYEDAFGYRENHNAEVSVELQKLNAYAKYFYIPVRVCFKPVGSSTVYYYDNSLVFQQPDNFFITQLADTNGVWTTTESYCYLAYYNVDVEERKNGTALGKWVANRQCTNAHSLAYSTQMQKQADGQYITYPTVNGTPIAGEIWVEVMGSGWKCKNLPDERPIRNLLSNLQEIVSMCLVKIPTLEIINNDEFEEDFNTDDVVYQAEVNASAKDELEIDTIMGSYVDGIPTAKGCYFRSNGTQLQTFIRDGVEACVEELLCGTLFSQYYDRHVALSGECRADMKRYLSFTETHQTNKKFICVSEVLDLRADTNEAKFIEYSPDNFER